MVSGRARSPLAATTAATAPAATHIVWPDGSGDLPTIQAAVDVALDGDPEPERLWHHGMAPSGTLITGAGEGRLPVTPSEAAAGGEESEMFSMQPRKLGTQAARRV